MGRAIWFQLVEKPVAERKCIPFAGVEAASVVGSDDVKSIGDLRNRIRDFYRLEEPALLAQVVVPGLAIYADTVAYDAKQEPLKLGLPIGSLGGSMESALIVEAPWRVAGVTADAQLENLLKTLEWKEPTRLCMGSGRDWPYQGAADIALALKRPHFDAWQRQNQDKQMHALNLVPSGSGTGKSRMLDEMKGLLCEAAAQSQNQELMLSKERRPWSSFANQLLASYPSLGLYIETVIKILAKLEKIDNVGDMTVILCVDGLQKLPSDCENLTEHLNRLMAALCRFVNSSMAFAVCVCAATAAGPLERALFRSSQVRTYLVPPPIRNHEVLAPRTRLERHLVDDMGGHGRALEALEEVLRRQEKVQLEEIDPAHLVEQVWDAVQSRYESLMSSGVFQDPTNRQELLVAIFSCSCFYSGRFDRIGSTSIGMTLDELQSMGLFRLTRERHLECAFVFLQMLMRKHFKTLDGIDASLDEHLTHCVLGWQRFDQLVAFHRRVKSMTYCNTPVSLRFLHAGARFSPYSILIHEPSPRTVVEVTKSGSEESEINAIVMNGPSDSAGRNILLRVQLTFGCNQINCNEVIRWDLRQTDQKIDLSRYEQERAKAVNVDSDVFLLITPAKVAGLFDLPERCGLVSKDEFDQYFGPFASRAHRSLLNPPDLNDHEFHLAEGLDDAKIVTGRKRDSFSSLEAAVSQGCSNKKCKRAEAPIIAALHCEGDETDP